MTIRPPRLTIPSTECKVGSRKLTIAQSADIEDTGFMSVIQDEYEPAVFPHPLGSYLGWRFVRRVKGYTRPNHPDEGVLSRCKLCTLIEGVPTPETIVMINAEDLPQAQTLEVG